MDELALLWPRPARAQNTLAALEKVAQRTQGHGLVLQREEMLALAHKNGQIVQQAGRIEFGEGILPKLVFAFCDSPYIAPAEFAGAVEQLLEAFYHFKNESGERLADDELLALMKAHFDGQCHGSMDLLCGTVLEEISRKARLGPLAVEDPEEDEDGEEGDDAQ